MKFSVIIPAYNVSRYLESCVQSILNQTFENYEIIIVDDGSTDNTGIIADELSQNYHQVAVIHQSNGGASKARNTGISNSSGDYLLFLDGDDFWSDTQFLDAIATKIKAKAVDVVIFGYSYYYGKEIKKIPVFTQNNLLTATNFGLFNGPNWNKCISKKLISKGLCFPEDLVSEDSLYCSYILKLVESFSILTSTQYMYRQNRAGSLTNIVKEANVLDTLRGIERGLFDVSELPDIKQKALTTYFAISYISIIPYAKSYLSNIEIKELLRKYKYLLKASIRIENKAFKLTGIFTNIFGINISTKIFSYLLRFYK